MAITRRQFLKRTGLGDGRRRSSARASSRNPFVRQALADTIGDRYFVVALPRRRQRRPEHRRPRRQRQRRRCAPPTTRTRGIDRRRLHPSRPAELGRRPPSATIRTPARSSRFHPGLARPARRSTTLGKVAVIQGCGYPEYSLSHEESRDHLADRRIRSALAATPAPAGSAATSPAQLRRQRHPRRQHRRRRSPASSGRPATSVLAVRRLRRLRLPVRRLRLGDDDDRASATAFAALYDDGGRRARSRSAATSATPASRRCSAARATRTLHDVYETDRARACQRRLRRRRHAARRATSARSRRSSTASSTGAAERQRALLPAEQRRLRHALRPGRRRARRPALRPARRGRRRRSRSSTTTSPTWASADNRVCVLVWSEFSRRIPQNDNGTDHGSQGPMFVIGGAVERRRLRQPSRTSTEPRSTTTATRVYSQAAAIRSARPTSATSTARS